MRGLLGGLLATIFFGVAFLAYAATTSNVLPSSEGTYLGWNKSTGSTHYTLVDETTCNSTDYVSTGTTTLRESFGVSVASIPDLATITSIAIVPCASRNNGGGGGSAVMDIFYRWNGANSADAGAYVLTGTTPVALATTTYSGLSLIKTSTSSLEIGAEYASGNKGARLSHIMTRITYTPAIPAAPSNLSAVAQAGTSSPYVTLSWIDNATNEFQFLVERSTNGTSYTQIGITPANIASYSDLTVASSTMYWYRVRANNIEGGTSGYSNVATTTTP